MDYYSYHYDMNSTSNCSFDNLESAQLLDSHGNLHLMEDLHSSIFFNWYDTKDLDIQQYQCNSANENLFTARACKAALMPEDEQSVLGYERTKGFDNEALEHRGKSSKRKYEDCSNDNNSLQQINKRLKGKSQKYSRAAHILSSRRRRAKISQKLEILKTLIPNGNKVDISTMLETAITYVKYLQLQIKLLSSDEYWMYNFLAWTEF